MDFYWFFFVVVGVLLLNDFHWFGLKCFCYLLFQSVQQNLWLILFSNLSTTSNFWKRGQEEVQEIDQLSYFNNAENEKEYIIFNCF